MLQQYGACRSQYRLEDVGFGERFEALSLLVRMFPPLAGLLESSWSALVWPGWSGNG